MWHIQENFLHLILRASLVYFTLLIGIRLCGKRDVGDMTPFDMVLLLLVANGLQNAMTGEDYSLPGGLIVGATLLIINFIVSRLSWRFKKVRVLIEGEPTPLIYKGRVLRKNMRSEKVTDEELQQALRENNVSSIDRVNLAMLEIDGSISIVQSEKNS